MLSQRVSLAGRTSLRQVKAAFHQTARKPSRTLQTKTMAQLVAYVKGDPNSQKLLDCPFCHRVLLTLEGKKVPYSMEYIDFEHKPQWLLDASGGKVPVIKDGDEPYLPDSDKIIVYLDEKYPEPSFKSEVPADIGAKLFPAFRGYLFGTPEEAAEKQAALEAELKAMNEYLSAHKGPLFGGEKMNATDAAVAPKLYHVLTALPHFKQWQLPAGLDAIKRYMDYIVTLPEWKAVDYGTEAIIKGWSKKH